MKKNEHVECCYFLKAKKYIIRERNSVEGRQLLLVQARRMTQPVTRGLIIRAIIRGSVRIRGIFGASRKHLARLPRRVAQGSSASVIEILLVDNLVEPRAWQRPLVLLRLGVYSYQTHPCQGFARRMHFLDMHYVRAPQRGQELRQVYSGRVRGPRWLRNEKREENEEPGRGKSQRERNYIFTLVKSSYHHLGLNVTIFIQFVIFEMHDSTTYCYYFYINNMYKHKCEQNY